MARRTSRSAGAAPGLGALLELALRVLRRVRDANAVQAELRERAWLRQQPWLEEYLHWSYDGGAWQLHGDRLPATGRGGRSVTRSGWCPGSSLPA